MSNYIIYLIIFKIQYIDKIENLNIDLVTFILVNLYIDINVIEQSL